MTRSGVDSHTWSLVKYHKVSVLVENIQGTGGGDNPAPISSRGWEELYGTDKWQTG